jgi:hypothetical protein
MNRIKIVIPKISSVDGMLSDLICKFHSSGMWKETVYRKSKFTWSTWANGAPTKLFLDSLESEYKHNTSNPTNVSRVLLRKLDSRSARKEILSLSWNTQFRLPAHSTLVLDRILSHKNPADCMFLMIIHKRFDPHFKFCASSHLLRTLFPKPVSFSSVYREK